MALTLGYPGPNGDFWMPLDSAFGAASGLVLHYPVFRQNSGGKEFLSQKERGRNLLMADFQKLAQHSGQRAISFFSFLGGNCSKEKLSEILALLGWPAYLTPKLQLINIG